VPAAPSRPPSVVVTGASSGIGRACALDLDARGWRVFAGVRREADGEALRGAASGRLVPLSLDVTDAAQIEAAVKQVGQAVGADGLQGLVNNAGVSVAGPLEYQDLDALRHQLEVNAVAPVAVTQVFLPLLRAGRGRIVHIGSMSGYVSAAFLGPYSASKHALEALNDAQRRELAPFGLHVALVQPGAIATEIWKKAEEQVEALIGSLSEEGRSRYEARARQVAEDTFAAARSAIPPSRVAAAVHHALTARRPRTRYRVGRDAVLVRWLTRLLPDRTLDWLLERARSLN